MSNIISLSGQRFASVLPDPPEPHVLAHSLRALFVVGVITKDAYFLGAQIVAQAQAYHAREIALSHDIAQKTLCKVQGSILTGPVSPDRTAFVVALQNLHFSARIISHYDANRLNDADVHDRHFTRNPDIGADSLWSVTSPIFFRLPTMPVNDYNAGISELFQDAVKGCTASMQIKL